MFSFRRRTLLPPAVLAWLLVLVCSAAAGPVPQMDSWDPGVLHPASNYVVSTFVENGKAIDEIVVPGRPPTNFRAEAAEVPKPDVTAGINVLSSVPAFDWSYGCSATSAAMMAGYYDNTGYPNMYAGPTNGGLCPMNNSVWGHTGYPSVTCGECPLSATHLGIDGRAIRGHVDDYWRDYNDAGADPFIGNWTEHVKGDCTADCMGTNQSSVGNPDGSTIFYSYTDGSALYDYTGGEPTKRDGCHGMRLFAESRGYTVTENFSQYIYGYNGNTKGFTFANFQAEIDAGRPVMIQVSGHSMVGYGYDSGTNTVYMRDTWDYSSHTMTWGGSYSGMQHYGVVVLRLASTKTATPAFSPAGGSYVLPQAVTISCATPGATIRYTLNGSDPTTGSTLYTGPVTINSNKTLKAKAWGSGIPVSDTATATYVVTGDMSIRAMKAAADGSNVGCEAAVLTAAFADSLYIEATDRSMGIRVEKPAHGITSGKVRVVGVIRTNSDGERYIEASAVAQNGAATVKPLALSNRSLGGSGWAQAGWGQAGIAGASGLNNVGLLVSVVGQVTFAGPDYFYVDDGSNVSDGSGHPGVKVLTNGFAPLPSGVFCRVTGASSCFSSGGSLRRLVRPVMPTDVTTPKGAVIAGGVRKAYDQAYLVESPHPYPDSYNTSWSITGPAGTTMLRVHFTKIEVEATYDYLYVEDASRNAVNTYSTSVTNVWSSWVTGSTLYLHLTSDFIVNYYGFQVDKYQYDGPLGGATVTISPGGRSMVTGADGAFYFEGLSAGNYTLTPSLTGATFTPANRTVTLAAGKCVAGQNFLKN